MTLQHSPFSLSGKETRLSRVLLIDDEPESFDLFCRAMLRAGVANPIDHANGGEQGIRYLDECLNGGRRWPCAVFLDIKMPMLNGFDVLTWMRNREILGKMVVVMMSSSRLPQDVGKSFQLGAHHYISKDAGADVVARLIQSAMRFVPLRKNAVSR